MSLNEQRDIFLYFWMRKYNIVKMLILPILIPTVF